MAVLLNTSAGDIVIDLFTEESPIATKNFIKLCQIKYYNNHLIYNIQQNYILQTGDPTGTGRGGNSIFGVLAGKENVCFDDEINESRKVNKVGYVGMAHSGGQSNTNRSQFFITLRGEDMEHLGAQHTIIGEIAEGLDVLETLNGIFCDNEGRPYQDVRIRHTYVLDDPFPDPDGLNVPPESPRGDFPPSETVKRRIPYEEKIDGAFTTSGMTEEEVLEEIRKKEARSRAIVLEMTGDLPDADIKPPDEVLFVCKLNPVTRDEDLETIFSQFGRIKSCEIIRDHKTGDSLNYAFIEFETEAACIRAYEKMNNALIDDRRIKVDFSQSVSKIWNKYLMRPRGGPKVNKDGTSVNKSATSSEKLSSGPSHYGPSATQQPTKSNYSHNHGRNESKTDASVSQDHRYATNDNEHHHRNKLGHDNRHHGGSDDYHRKREDSRHSRDRGHKDDKYPKDRDSHRDKESRSQYRERSRSRSRDRRDREDRGKNDHKSSSHRHNRDDRSKTRDESREKEDRNSDRNRDRDNSRDRKRDDKDHRDKHRSREDSRHRSNKKY